MFTKTFLVSDKYFPKPAINLLPEWYKKTKSYYGKDGNVNFSFAEKMSSRTIKKCMPVVDSLSTGYIIETYCDILVQRNKEGKIFYSVSEEFPRVEEHPVIQAPYHPEMNNNAYPKIINPWSIKTPPGYSCFFIPPVHSSNKYFKVLEGVVDTDKYISPINFPFVLNDVNFEGVIPAGTPVVQIIPFKRDTWKSTAGNEKTINLIKEYQILLVSKFLNRYKQLSWTKKEYR